MSKTWKYIFNISMSALAILSIGAPVTNTSVSARHVRIHHMYRHFHKSRKVIHRLRSRKRMHKYHSYNYRNHKRINRKSRKNWKSRSYGRKYKRSHNKLWQPITYPEIPRDSNWRGWQNDPWAMQGYSPNTWAPSGDVVTPTKTKNNEFYKLFNKALKHTSKRIQREPFSIRDLKHLDYVMGHGGHYVVKNNKFCMAQYILTGGMDQDPVSIANCAYDDTPETSFYYNPVSQVSYGDKSAYKQSMAFNRTDEITLRTLLDLNKDRQSIGEEPLQWSTGLDEIAQKRSQQLTQNYSHYDPNNNGEPYALEDGLSPQNWGENIAESSGESLLGTANTINKMFFYDEEPTNGIHYRNIANNTRVGVGATIKNGTTYLAEDFE